MKTEYRQPQPSFTFWLHSLSPETCGFCKQACLQQLLSGLHVLGYNRRAMAEHICDEAIEVLPAGRGKGHRIV